MKRRARKSRFTIKEFTNPSGATAYRVAGTKQDGSRVRENFKTYEEAVSRQQELLIEFGNDAVSQRLRMTSLSDEQLRECERVYAGLPPDKSLSFVLEWFRKNYRDALKPIPMQTAFDTFIAEKEIDNLRPDSIRNLRQRVGHLVNMMPRTLVSNVQPGQIKDALKGKSPVDANNYMRAWSNFFRWSIRNEHRPDNPLAPIGKRKIDRGKIAILSMSEICGLLAAARDYRDGDMVPYVTLFLFGGVRHSEIERLTWDDIDFEDGTISVDDDVAKMRARRTIEMPRIGAGGPNLLAWLKPHRIARKPFVGPAWRDHFKAVKEAAGFGTPTKEKPDLKPWVQDIIRHTSITYHLAWSQHEGRTATWAGNSPNIVQQHYKGRGVKERDAIKFWKLRPSSLKTKGKVIQLQKAA